MNNAHTVKDDVRLDKWLWAARLFKTRSLAVQAIDAGQVRVNEARAKPSRNVRVGDRIAFSRTSARIELVVKALSGQRGPATVAATLYDETEASIAARMEAVENHKENIKFPGGRPTKRDRRQLEQLKRN